MLRPISQALPRTIPKTITTLPKALTRALTTNTPKMSAPGPRMDPDFLAAMAALNLPPMNPPPPKTVFDYRNKLNNIFGMFLSFPIPESITETKHAVTAPDGEDIDLYRLLPAQQKDAKEPQPAIIYTHGGGMVACKVEEICKPNLARLADESGIQVFAPEYRLAPEFPDPTPVEDCYAALGWVISNASSLNVDPKRIAIMGESAGGGLAAGLTLLARDRNLQPPIAGQLLLHPMLDDRSSHTFKESSPRDQALKKDMEALKLCWGAYVGDAKRGDPKADVSPYASPARAESLVGLPRTYIDVAGMDWLRNEALEFGARCAREDVDLVMHLYPGVPHCFDLMTPNCQAAKNVKENRFKFLREI